MTLSVSPLPAPLERYASNGRSDTERKVLIELVDVHKRYGKFRLFQGLNLTVYEGESVVVMGESGSGKSQLLGLMNGLVLPDAGHVRIFGEDTRQMKRKTLMAARQKIGTLFQNYALFDSMTVEENVAFPLVELKGEPRAEAAKKAHELLKTLGLSDAGNLFPASLSGGMKKRVSLARALITNPEVVLFDEPTTGLDPVMIEFVDQMLIEAQKNYDLTSVIISHDMASAFHLADRMAMLHNGRISFIGTPEQTRHTTQPEVQAFVGRATSRLSENHDKATTGEQQEQTRVKNESVDIHAEGEQPHNGATHIAYRSQTGAAVEGETDGLAWADLPEPEVEPIVSVIDVHKSFGDREILKGASFYVMPNQITTIIGGSGSGKSVLMKHVLGLFQPTAG